MILRLLTLTSLLLSFLLMGCSPPETTTQLPPNSQIPISVGQELPISAQVTVPNGTIIKLEVAQTPEQQELGLMYRPALPANQGMLFSFPFPQPVQFWMKHVPVALDMVFLKNGIVKYIKTAPPCTADPCPTYGPNVQINQVIELREKRASELGLTPGDKLKIELLTTH